MEGTAEKKHVWKQAIPLILVVLAVLVIFALFRWQSHPSTHFYAWVNTPSEDPTWTGLTLSLDEFSRNLDGSASVQFTVSNTMEDTKATSLFWWVDYYYQGSYHNVYPGSVARSLVYDKTTFDPGESETQLVQLEPKALALEGHYRFCMEDVGWILFFVSEDGRAYPAASNFNY